MACIVYDATATSATVLVFGWSFLTLLSALLRGFTGYLLIRYLSTGAAAFTLILASFLIVGGLFRAVGAEVVKFPRWGWSVFSGIVSVALGIMLLAQMPASSVWFIGFAIGVDMILDGVSLVAFAMAIHGLPAVPVRRAA